MAVCVLIVVRTGGVCEECVEARLTSGQEPRTTLELWSALVSQNYSHTQTTPHLTSLHAVSPTYRIIMIIMLKTVILRFALTNAMNHSFLNLMLTDCLDALQPPT